MKVVKRAHRRRLQRAARNRTTYIYMSISVYINAHSGSVINRMSRMLLFAKLATLVGRQKVYTLSLRESRSLIDQRSNDPQLQDNTPDQVKF